MTVLTEDVVRLGHIFAQNGKQLYLVGGSVRDALLGRESQDIDLATDALPEEIKRLGATAAPASMFTVGEKFGTIGLVFHDTKVEITTFRAEQYEPKIRKPEVRFGTSLEGDLSRRDFTINAMAQNIVTSKLFDPFGGLSDLGSKLIRAVGRAEERFAEDPLRMLRAVRFASQLSFRIENKTRDAIKRQAATLQHISRERVSEEMTRILLSPNPGKGIRMLTDLDLMACIIPEFLDLRGMQQDRLAHKDIYEHTLSVIDNTPPDLAVRWAAVLHDIAKPKTISWEEGEVHFIGHEFVGEAMAREILTNLRYDSRIVAKVAKLVRMHTRVNQYSSEWTDGAVRRLIREAGEDLEDMFALSRADITSQRPAKVEAALARIAELEARVANLLEQENVKALTSPLDGNELMAIFGRKPGPWIRDVKEYLLSLVIEGILGQDEKERAEGLAREFLRQREESA